jgi:hypothetical protein
MKKIELKYSEEKYRRLEFYLRKKYPKAKKSTTVKTLIDFYLLEMVADFAKKESDKALKRLNIADIHDLKAGIKSRICFNEINN